MFASIIERPQVASSKRAARKQNTILIVDDDAALRDVLSRRLQQQGYATMTAESAALGLQSAREARPNLILLDLRLPDSDGLTVCAQLADMAETCSIPVIILTGMAQPDILRRCRAAGCHFFLRKPYDPNVLLALVRQAIQDSNAWNEQDYGT
jgi:CheY-like chemotaxis protein